MKNIIIVCSDSFGLDVKKIVLSINESQKKIGLDPAYKVKGYIGMADMDDGLKPLLSPYLGNIGDYKPSENEFFVMGIVNPQKKKSAVELLKAKGACFETIRAPWVLAHADFVFPEGCVIAAHSVMDSSVIGKFATLFYAMVGFDAVVEDYSSIMAYANITTAHIGQCAYIGNNSVIMGTTVGDEAVILPNSVVVRKVKPGLTVSGNPAKRIRSKEG